jgi:hypothetical protein
MTKIVGARLPRIPSRLTPSTVPWSHLGFCLVPVHTDALFEPCLLCRTHDVVRRRAVNIKMDDDGPDKAIRDATET